MAQDRFPSFADGDVKIVITPSRQYTLHSNVLKHGSPLMRALLDPGAAAPLSARAIKHGAGIYYKLVLFNSPGANPIPYDMVRVDLDSEGRPINNECFGVDFDFEAGKVVPAEFTAFDAVLGAFYGIPIKLGDFQEDDVCDLLATSLNITAVAQFLYCTRVITSPIEATLQAAGQDLYKAISNDSLAWLDFAYRIKSKVLFRESLIHAAGQFNLPGVQETIRRGELDDGVLEVLEGKAKEIIDAVKRAQNSMASYYPSMLMRGKVMGRADIDGIGRAAYGNDILTWMALSAFRHWCNNVLVNGATHHAPDMGYGFIKATAEGGNEYLSRQNMQDNFHTRFPMSIKGMACVEHRLAEIKENIKQWAKPFLRSACQLDVNQHPVQHFTFVNVRSTDYPWYEDEVCDSEDEYDGDNGEDPLADCERLMSMFNSNSDSNTGDAGDAENTGA